MLPMSLIDFKEYYKKKGRFPMGLYTPAYIPNEKQIQTLYGKYVTKINKKENKRQEYFDNAEKQDSLSEETKDLVVKRDKYICRLWSILKNRERSIAIENGYDNYFVKKLTFAHFIPRSINKDLVNSLDNVYQISLLFHNRLDKFQDPLTGEFTDKSVTLNWWKRIIGDDDLFNKLIKK
jgi:hypothetical protein